jgi:hypothetical protein
MARWPASRHKNSIYRFISHFIRIMKLLGLAYSIRTVFVLLVGFPCVLLLTGFRG